MSARSKIWTDAGSTPYEHADALGGEHVHVEERAAAVRVCEEQVDREHERAGVLAADQREVPAHVGDAPHRAPARFRLAGFVPTSCNVVRNTCTLLSVVVDDELVVQCEAVDLPPVDHRGAVRMRDRRDRTRPVLLHGVVQDDVVCGPGHARRLFLRVAHEVEDDHRFAGDGVGRLADRAVRAVHLEIEAVPVTPRTLEPPAHLVLHRVAPRRELVQDHRVAHRAPERREIPDRRRAFELRGVDVRGRERAARAR